MAGQNLGAARPSRATRVTVAGVAVASGLLALVGLGQWLAPVPIATAFVPDISVTGRRYAVSYLRILAYGYPAIGASALLVAGFNATERTRIGLVADLVKYWGVRLPVAALALPPALAPLGPGADLGVGAVFWAVTGSNVVAAVGLAGYFVLATRRNLFAGAVGG